MTIKETFYNELQTAIESKTLIAKIFDNGPFEDVEIKLGLCNILIAGEYDANEYLSTGGSDDRGTVEQITECGTADLSIININVGICYKEGGTDEIEFSPSEYVALVNLLDSKLSILNE